VGPAWRGMSVIVANIRGLVGRREPLGRGPGVQGFPGRLEFGLGGVDVAGRSHRHKARQIQVLAELGHSGQRF